MAPTVDACDRMISACRKSGVLLFISQMRRFNLGFQKIRELVIRGILGELVELNVNWPFFIPEIDRSPYREVLSWMEKYLHVNLAERYGSWRLKDPRSGGGNFLDHGPHIIDFFRWIAGDITHVTGSSRVLLEGRNEDYTKCVLKFKSGATGYITTTLYDFKYGLIGKAYGFIRGTKARVDFTLPDPVRFKPIRYLKIYKEPGSDLRKIFTLATLKRFGGKRIRLPKNYVFKDQLDYFLRSILGKRKPHPVFGKEDFAAKGEDGRYAIKIVELVYEAAKAEEPVWLPVT
jgi:predicted dehydrogenase